MLRLVLAAWPGSLGRDQGVCRSRYRRARPLTGTQTTAWESCRDGRANRAHCCHSCLLRGLAQRMPLAHGH